MGLHVAQACLCQNMRSTFGLRHQRGQTEDERPIPGAPTVGHRFAPSRMSGTNLTRGRLRQ